MSEQFWLQHRRLTQAVRRHGLPPNPLAGMPPRDLVEAALEEVAKVGGRQPDRDYQGAPAVG